MSEPWDVIDPASLLPLVGVRRMTRQFGFLLRHYWMPATELTFQRTAVRQSGNSKPTTTGERIIRRMARCDADICCWRESVSPILSGASEPVFPENYCIYNRSEQTFRIQEITGKRALPESEKDARIQAFIQQSILTPLLPIPLGFQWHVSTDEGDYMDFTLESETTVEEMPVVFVRRKGRFRLDGIGTVERKGLTAFALERSTILEDRTLDVVSETGLETRIQTKLVQSRLVE